MSKKEERQPVPPPALFPIDQALLHLFSQDPGDQEAPQQTPTHSFFAHDDWLLPEPAEPPRDEVTASAASGKQGADRAAAAGAERSEPQPHQRGQQRSEQVEPPPMQALEATCAGFERPPARDSELLRLPAWMRRYVLGIRTFGVTLLAAQHANVSRRFVDDSRKASPEFDEACRNAERDALDAVEAATIQSATVGDVQPVFQGGSLVGYKRMKNPKAAELLFKKAGYLEDKPPTVDDRLKVDAVTDAELAARFSETMQRLYAERRRQPLLDAETGKPVTE